MKLRIIHDTFVNGEHLAKNDILDLDPDDANENETIGHLNAARRVVEVGSKSEEIWEAEESAKAGKRKTKAQGLKEDAAKLEAEKAALAEEQEARIAARAAAAGKK